MNVKFAFLTPTKYGEIWPESELYIFYQKLYENSTFSLCSDMVTICKCEIFNGSASRIARSKPIYIVLEDQGELFSLYWSRLDQKGLCALFLFLLNFFYFSIKQLQIQAGYVHSY